MRACTSSNMKARRGGRYAPPSLRRQEPPPPPPGTGRAPSGMQFGRYEPPERPFTLALASATAASCAALNRKLAISSTRSCAYFSVELTLPAAGGGRVAKEILRKLSRRRRPPQLKSPLRRPIVAEFPDCADV